MGPYILHQYDVTQDGRFLVNTSLDDLSMSPFNVIVNWPQLLKDR